MRLTHGLRNLHFTILLKALCLHITTHALKYFFSKCTFNARSGKRMFNKTPVLRTLLDVRKTCVNERMLNTRYSIYMLTMRYTYVYHAFKKTYVLRMLHIFLCINMTFENSAIVNLQEEGNIIEGQWKRSRIPL